MKTTILVGLMVLSTFIVGCTTRGSQHWIETAIDEKGNKFQVVKRVVYPADSSWDKPAVKDTIYQTCPISALDKAFNKLDADQCVSEHDHHNGMTYTRRTHDSNGPVLAGAVSTVPLAAGIAASGAMIRPSRTNNNVTQNGGDTTTNEFFSTKCTAPCFK